LPLNEVARRAGRLPPVADPNAAGQRIAGTPAAESARQLIEDRLSRFRLGQRDHAALFPATDWTDFRKSIDDAIEALRRK
jgi:hypothetical protein